MSDEVIDHIQVTDADLLAVAVAHGGRLVTAASAPWAGRSLNGHWNT